MEDLDLEAGKLKRANENLRAELENLKQMVAMLREQRGGDDNREGEEESEQDREDRLLQLENELLRAQLREQREFLAGCRELMDHIPELKISNNNKNAPNEETSAALRRSDEDLMEQGAENAITHLLLLVSRSQNCDDWQAVQLPEHCFSTAVPGFNVTCNFRKETRTAPPPSLLDSKAAPEEEAFVCIRVDACFPSISPEAVAGAYWSTWTNKKSFTSVFNAFFGGGSTSPPENGEEEATPFVIKELLRGSKVEGEVDTRVNLYRELHDGGADARDWIYCMTKQRREIAMSTLNMASELNPSVAARRIQHTRKVVGGDGPLPARKRGKGCSSSSQLMGRQECIVLARTCMQGSEQSKALAELSANRTVAEDGLFAWQDEVSIDFQVECEGGREIQRRRVPAARASSFIAFPTRALVHDTDLYSAVMDASGRATEKYARLIDVFYTMMGLGGNKA